MTLARPNRSPWLAQLPEPGPARPLLDDADTDVAIVGAGIAGVATAFFVLRATSQRVLVLEAGRPAHGATGHNAGQLATYFERPLYDIAAEHGDERAIAGQRIIDEAHELLDVLIAEAGADVRVDRFIGHMGMSTANHVEVHLRNNLLRRKGGLREEEVLVSEDWDLLRELPPELGALCRVVPQRRIRELLGVGDDRYRAVLSNSKGCANGALLIHEVLAHLERAHPDRFRLVDHTAVSSVVLHDGHAVLDAGGHRVTADRVVLCTNGYIGHLIDNRPGPPIPSPAERLLERPVGYMAAFTEPTLGAPEALSFIRNEVVGGAVPYVYVTRRPHDGPDGTVGLTAIGGPERILEPGEEYDPAAPVPTDMENELGALRPYAERAPTGTTRPDGGAAYDYAWHGLMGYTPGRLRMIGSEPRNPVLLYNLGCNGVGFLPSIAGAARVARLIAGETLDPCIFDPR